MYPYNLEINKSTVPSGAVNLFDSQITNSPAISSPVPQPVQMTPGVSRSDLLPGNQKVIPIPLSLCVRTSLPVIDQQVHLLADQTHFCMKGFARLVQKNREKLNRKWSVP